MRFTWLVIVVAAACNKSPKQDTTPAFARQLGESTASPGADASKPPPVTPDDPRVMNVSASITPSQLDQAQGAPVQPAPAREEATSSTPVPPPADIAPRSTTEQPNQPNVNSPPPPPAPRSP